MRQEIRIIGGLFRGKKLSFPDDESQEKPTLESFGVTGAGPVNSFENIISKIEEI